MIYSFSFKNFCSFADRATISFEDIRKGLETKNNMFAETEAGGRLAKVMILVGPNASGKTNALKALAFLSWFVRYSFIQLEGEKAEIPVDAFAFTDQKGNVSEFELIFEHKKKVYKYILHLCRTHILKEELHVREESQHFNYKFKRNWDPKQEKSTIVQRLDMNTEVLEGILRKNVSLISAAVAINNDFLKDIAEFWGKIMGNVFRLGKSWDTSSLGKNRLSEATEAYNRDQNLLKKAEKFLKDIDLGLDGISIKEHDSPDPKTGEPKKVYIPFGVHNVNQVAYELPFTFESSGTKNMFVLLRLLIPVIEMGGIAVIDELEIDLHPHTLPCIIGLFANPDTNPKGSQLLFTSHSLEVLNHLEKEQIVLVEKKKDCKSELYRLDELKGVRRDDNIYSKYMAGAYGAVPNI
ncbi:MAG: ATP-binding protein [Elusimicrobia bacterium]|nr:ATP-binding protein [Candidatus Obscuribacterium magneticum]